MMKQVCELEHNLNGSYTEKFKKVAETFKKNFAQGWETSGAAVTIYHKNELVLDLHGGFSDKEENKLWDKDTLTVVFSVSKSIGALCVALLIDKGLAEYDDKVVKYWPEFGQNGKENVTIRHIMSHRAGLAYFEDTISLADANDHVKIAKIIESTKPNWVPGEKSGYHAITYGWLVDQLIRKVDPLNRGISQFFKEEIGVPHGINFHLGLNEDLEKHVSNLVAPSIAYRIKEILHDPRVLIVIAIINAQTKSSIAHKVKNNFDWMKVDQKEISFNRPEVHSVEQTAALGITKSSDLGKLFALVLNGKIISKSLVNTFITPEITNEVDVVFKAPMAKGHGFLYEKHPTKKDKWLVGHPGFGGSTIMMDVEDELVISYVTNGLKSGMGELTRTYRVLRNAAIKCAV
uniref:Beta-lactamase domain-containing protein n=1 Tax=Rhabditophanes sp. KR3021 TaxID=114890 RepID=A0AC35U5F9_9BILA